MANTVRIDKLCPAVFGISDRRYRQLAKEGIVPPVEDGRVDFITAVKHLLSYYQKLVEGQGAITLTEERARLTKYMADKAKLEMEKTMGALVEASEVDRAWAAMGQACRSRLLSLPVNLAHVLAGLRTQEIKQILEERIYEALNELAAGGQDVIVDVMPAAIAQAIDKEPNKCQVCGKRIGSKAIRCKKCAGRENVKKRELKKQASQKKGKKR